MSLPSVASCAVMPASSAYTPALVEAVPLFLDGTHHQGVKSSHPTKTTTSCNEGDVMQLFEERCKNTFHNSQLVQQLHGASPYATCTLTHPTFDELRARENALLICLCQSGSTDNWGPVTLLEELFDLMDELLFVVDPYTISSDMQGRADRAVDWWSKIFHNAMWKIHNAQVMNTIFNRLSERRLRVPFALHTGRFRVNEPHMFLRRALSCDSRVVMALPEGTIVQVVAKAVLPSGVQRLRVVLNNREALLSGWVSANIAGDLSRECLLRVSADDVTTDSDGA